MLQTFKYTDLKGKVSNRTVLVLEDPSPKKHLLCIDLSDLTDEEQVGFCQEVKALQNDYSEKLQGLQLVWDLKHSLRTFLVERMENVQSEDI